MQSVTVRLERLYERRGSGIVLVAIAGGVAVYIATGLLTAAGLALYLQLSFSDYFEILAITMPVNFICGVATLYTTWDLFKVGRSWSGADRTPERAAAVWNAGVRGPYVVSRRLIFITCTALVAVTPVVTAAFGQPAWVAAPIFIGGAAGIVAAAVLIAFGAELVLRPLLQDVAEHLPGDFEPVRAWRLQTKALAPLPAVTFFAALAVGAMSNVHARADVRFTVAVGVAVGMLALASLVFVILMRSTLDPVDELLAATHRIREGDLATRVHVVTGDDLGQLSSSFNQMMDGLQEREQLRAENTELLEDLRASRARIVAASDAERRRVERNIHDGAQQRLVAVAVKLRVLEEQAAGDDCLRGELATAGEHLRTALEELRELARGLHPAILTTEGLLPAIEQLAEHTDLPITISGHEERYPEAIELAAYFVACEALANVAKYAQAKHVDVEIKRDNGRLVLRIVDDGVGGANPDSGSGLTGLEDRLAAIDGRLSVQSPPGAGTELTAELPLP